MSVDAGVLTEVIRLIVAGGQPLVRGALLERLRREEGLSVFAEAPTTADLLRHPHLDETDVIVLDAELAADLCETIEALRARFPDIGVVVLTGTERVNLLLPSVEAGARGAIAKDRPIDELVHAIKVVFRGGAYVAPLQLMLLLDALLAATKQRNDAMRAIVRLSRREREVLRLLSKGASREGIAKHLVISPDTARTHVQNVLRKLGVHSRLEAAAFATRNPVLESLLADESSS